MLEGCNYLKVRRGLEDPLPSWLTHFFNKLVRAVSSSLHGKLSFLTAWWPGESGRSHIIFNDSVLKSHSITLQHSSGHRFGFPKLRVPLLTYNPWCMQAPSSPLHVDLWELGFGWKNADTLVTALAGSNILSSVSDPGVSCLRPVSRKRRQANLLACKQGKTSGPAVLDSPPYTESGLSLIEICDISFWNT